MPEEKTSGAKAAAAPAQSSSDDNLFGALCYIIGILVPLFVLFTDKKSNKFLAFHAWQSLIFTAVWIVIWIGLTFLTVVLSFQTSGLGGFLGCLFLPLGLVVLVGVLFVAYKAYQGEKFKMPIIGDFAEKQAK
jgi:uncharacterized membrane protein